MQSEVICIASVHQHSVLSLRLIVRNTVLASVPFSLLSLCPLYRLRYIYTFMCSS